MPPSQVIATDYAAYDDANFVMLAGRILDGLHRHPDYPAPPYSPADAQALLDQLTAAASAARSSQPDAASRRDYARTQAEAALAALSAYATAATPARPDLWVTAGFPVTWPTGERQLSRPVTGLALATGPAPHTLAARADAQAGMRAYAWRVFPQSTPPRTLATGYCYRFCLTPQPHVLLDGLDRGVMYGVECAAWNDTGPLQWSAPVFGLAP